ncbi:MAG: MBOAT family protein [Clostridium sp.]|uniref:MBOAT family O-acyltransferase n=1 Tax=Clostridium sp. TaxID=1506 RepID=UPI002A8F3D1A|nr:MBOAT family protein [Clostridium sp.]MDY5099103.1 MBOAT family O-acyltransferase [Clostridium sp.]
MNFNSLQFITFLPIVLILYYAVPFRFRHILLLAASYVFYGAFSKKYAMLLFLFTFISYFFARLIVRAEDDRKRAKFYLVTCIALHVAALGYFKYSNFGIQIVNSIAGTSIHQWDIIMPLGISFYTFKALSYLIDVYRNKNSIQRNFFKYAAYIAYFPQVTSGPIERSERFFSELDAEKDFDEKDISSGVIRMLWGFMKKMVIVDRMSVIVGAVYGSYMNYGKAVLFITTLIYSIEIYFDFSAYSDISIGISRMFGFRFMENFKFPYCAKSIGEFWRRWHMSLSLWFRDYLYIPLGGNRKGAVRQYINIVIVFLVSGIWHGASFNFIFWGFLHGFYQVVGAILKPAREYFIKLFKVDKERFSYKLGQTVVTFMLVNFAWIFFRAEDVKDGFAIVKQMVMGTSNLWQVFDGTMYNLGLTQSSFDLMFVMTIIVLIFEYVHNEKHDLVEGFSRQGIIFRCLMYYLILFVIFIFGIYGASNGGGHFIYGQF